MRISLLFLLLFTAFSKSNAQAGTKNFIDLPYIEVNGKADSLVTPNEIYLKIIVSEKDNRGRTSLEEQETKMIEALKALQIDTQKDLSLNDILSNFRFYVLKRTDIFTTKEYILKLYDAPTTSKVFQALESLSISNISIDRLWHSNLENIKNEVRLSATADAKKRATAIASSLNQNVGAAIHIVEGDQQATHILQGKAAGLQIRGYASTAKYEPADVAFDKIIVSSSIAIKFQLK